MVTSAKSPVATMPEMLRTSLPRFVKVTLCFALVTLRIRPESSGLGRIN